MLDNTGRGTRLAWSQGTGSQGFLDAYEPLRQKHGDWLAFIADCELHVPRVVSGGLCSSAGGILQSYGVDIRGQLEDRMADLGGMARFASDQACAMYSRIYRDIGQN